MASGPPAPRGWFHTAAQSGEVFANTEPDDLLIRTSTPTQRLLMGPACAGRVSAMQVGADAVTLNTPTVMHGSLFIGIAGGTLTNGGGYSAGCGTPSLLDDVSVTTPKISPGAITTACLAVGAVTASRLGRGAVGADALAPLAVGTASLADAGVTSSKLAVGCVSLSALSAELSAPRFDVWTLVPPPPASSPHASSSFLYADCGRDPAVSAYLALSQSSGSSTLNPSSGLITLPVAGVYEMTSSFQARSSCNDLSSPCSPPSTWLAPLLWMGSNIVAPPRLGYAVAHMAPGGDASEYSGTMRSSFTGVFRGGDVVALKVSAGGWTTSAAQPSGIWFDTSCNAAYVSITLLRPLLMP